METRWRSPPERFCPFSPQTKSSPRSDMSAESPAPSRAASTRSGAKSPNIVTFFSMLLLNIKTSCCMTESSS